MMVQGNAVAEFKETIVIEEAKRIYDVDDLIFDGEEPYISER